MILGPHGTGPEIIRIDLILEKHGAFYHPVRARIRTAGGQSINLGVIGAVSAPGRSLLESESALISQLSQGCSDNYLPVIFASDTVHTPMGPVSFFLSQWFDNYLEFHVTHSTGKKTIGLWEPDGTIRHISFDQARDIFRKAAFILTHFYNPITMEQIFPWHHAAGDFITKPLKTGFDVKLISVRGYSSMLEIDPEMMPDEQRILTGLLHFLLNLTLRIRLDRTDGTQEPDWLPDSVVKAAIDGFIEGLALKEKKKGLEGIQSGFLSFIARLTQDQIEAVTRTIVKSYSDQIEETGLIVKNFSSHCRSIHTFLSRSR